MRIFILSLFIVHFSNFGFAQQYNFSGSVKDSANGEFVANCALNIDSGKYIISTNAYGYFSISLPEGEHQITFTKSGFTPLVINIHLKQAYKANYQLQAEAVLLATARVKLRRSSIDKVEMGTNNLAITQIKKIPALLGEVDVVRSIQLLPGVSTVGEGASGFNVRGGNTDQNLILLDEAPVFNPSHLFGFFSVFNPDAVKDVKLIKGGIPSIYGGRLSSVLDVRMKEGNNKKMEGNGGVGLIFSRLSLEGPIKKDKASFIVAGRRSYADVLMKPFVQKNQDLKDAVFYFYDLTGKVNWNINDNNKLFVSSYLGRDVFGVPNAKFNWGNTTLTARWNHIFNKSSSSVNKFLNTTFYYSNFSYGLGFKADDASFDWDSKIKNISIKPDLIFYLNSKNTLSTGMQATYYTFFPGNATSIDEGVTTNFGLPKKYAVELAAYADNEQKVLPQFTVRYGIRYSYFNYMGKGSAYTLQESKIRNMPKTIVNTQNYKSGETIQDYGNFEPRISAVYVFNKRESIKLGYNRMAQYLHLISNTAASVPLDVWTPSTNNIKPQLADQIAFGYFKNIGRKLDYETSVEVYYKKMYNQIDYIDGADLLLNQALETQLLNGKGRAFGIELYLKKNVGKLNGWISYTLSKSERKVLGINNEMWYPNRFDRRHNLNVIASYSLSNKVSLNANFVFASGTPITMPTDKYSVAGLDNIPFNPNNKRNDVRIKDYHRFDIGATIKAKKHKKWQGEWVFSVYNVYARKNAFSIYATPSFKGNNTPSIVQFSVIGTVVPAVSYNFNF